MSEAGVDIPKNTTSESKNSPTELTRWGTRTQERIDAALKGKPTELNNLGTRAQERIDAAFKEETAKIKESDGKEPSGGEKNKVEKLQKSDIDISAKSIESDQHPGRNEDSILNLPEKQAFGVFDGMGGNAGGEIASKTARDFIEAKLKNIPDGLSLEQTQNFFKQTFAEANQKILDKITQNPKLKDMGATASVVKIWKGSQGERKAIIGNVGDSRVYIYRNEKLSMTLDDNDYGIKDKAEIGKMQLKLSEVTDLSTLNDFEKLCFSKRNEIFQTLGNNYTEARIRMIDLQKGDKIIVTSDGIHDNLTTKEITDIMKNSKSSKEAADKLIKAAQDRSKDVNHLRHKPDDMSAIIAEIKEKESLEESLKAEPSPVVSKVKELTKEEKEKIRIELVKINKEKLDKELKNKIKNTTDPHEKAMLEALKERWKNGEKLKIIEEDFKKITENPEQLMKEFLSDRFVDGKRVYTDAEIESLLADKSEKGFYKKMEPEIIMQVLRRKALEGGLTLEDVDIIYKTPWERDAVEQFFEKNKGAQKIVEKAIAKEEGEKVKITGKEGKKLWEEVKKRPWLLVLIFGLVGGLPGAIVGLAYIGLRKKGV